MGKHIVKVRLFNKDYNGAIIEIPQGKMKISIVEAT